MKQESKTEASGTNANQKSTNTEATPQTLSKIIAYVVFLLYNEFYMRRLRSKIVPNKRELGKVTRIMEIAAELESTISTRAADSIFECGDEHLTITFDIRGEELKFCASALVGNGILVGNLGLDVENREVETVWTQSPDHEPSITFMDTSTPDPFVDIFSGTEEEIEKVQATYPEF